MDEEHGSEEHNAENLQEGAAREGQEDPAGELREDPEREQAKVVLKHGPGQGRQWGDIPSDYPSLGSSNNKVCSNWHQLDWM